MTYDRMWQPINGRGYVMSGHAESMTLVQSFQSSRFTTVYKSSSPVSRFRIADPRSQSFETFVEGA